MYTSWAMNHSQPRISIVTVCLNRRGTIERTLESVLGQAYPQLEYIVIDGGSRDGTADVIRAHEGSLAYWVSEPDCGISHAFNKGIARATGDLVGIVSAGDALPEGVLRRVAELWTEEPAVDVLYGDAVVHGTLGEPMIVRADPDFSAVWRRTPVKHAATWVARSTYERLGVFDPRWRVAMDYELMLRFHLRGARFRYVREVLGAFELGGLSDARFWTAQCELRDISIHYGYPREKADFWYALNLVRPGARRLLENRLGIRAIVAYRRLSGRFAALPSSDSAPR